MPDLHVDALVADSPFSADLSRERHCGDYLAHQRAFLALVVEDESRFGLELEHALLGRRTGERLF